jgi:hypothetical protein
MLRAGSLETTDPIAAETYLGQIDRLLAGRDAPRPLVRLVEDDVLRELAADPAFVGPLGEDVGAVVALTVRYVARRIDFPEKFMRADFTEESVVEKHLAEDFEQWIAANWLQRGVVTTEVRRIAAGRADVLIAFGTHRVVVELKRELADASRTSLENSYADQAASYQATDYPFGVVLVLDLSGDQESAAPHLADQIWVSKVPVRGRDRWLVWCVVPGKRVSPSQLSR